MIAVARFLGGWAGSVAAGWVAFDAFGPTRSPHPAASTWAVLDPRLPSSQCVTVGAVAALMIVFVRGRRPHGCVALGIGWVALQTGLALDLTWPGPLARPLWTAIIAAGLFVVALVYDVLAVSGHRIGKFLIVGPLLAGLYVAATPAALMELGPSDTLLRQFLLNSFLGLVIGDGSALGVELVDLGLGDAAPAEPAAAS